ncbi:hypothetical protein V8E36_009845, partial [Tilletia maclaganii]
DWSMTTDEDESEMEVATALPVASGKHKRKKHPDTPTGTPRKKKPNLAKRTALGVGDDADLRIALFPGAPSTGGTPTEAATRQSTRIAENNIQPASGAQEVRHGVRLKTVDPEEAAAAAKRTTRPSTPPSATNEEGEGPAPRARPAQVLAALANAATQRLKRRQKKEDGIQSFFKQMAAGLRELDALEALEGERLDVTNTLLSAATLYVLGEDTGRKIPARLLRELKAWCEGKDVPDEPSQGTGASKGTSATGKDKPSGTMASSWASVAKKNGARPTTQQTRPRPVPLQPLDVYRTQGGQKGDVQRLHAEGPVKDERIFIRFEKGSAAAKEDPHAVRLVVEKSLKDQQAPETLVIERVKSVATGFSLLPGRSNTAQDFHKYLPDIVQKLNASHADLPCTFRRVCMRGLPASIWSGGEDRKITCEHLQAALGARFPSLVFAETPRVISTATRPGELPLWLLTLSSGTFGGQDDDFVPSHLMLMDRDCYLRSYRDNNASKHCSRCLSWHHSTVRCRPQAPVCGHCVLTGHLTKDHTCSVCPPVSVVTGATPSCLPECAHCMGPSPTRHRNCPARPIWSKDRNAVIVPEGERLVRIRNQGRASRTAELNRLRAA